MKSIQILYILLFFFSACKTKETKDETKISTIDSSSIKKEPQIFFPVTEYIKGQAFEIRNSNINPLKIVKVHEQLDSSWIKMEDLEKEIVDFLSPEIDTSNLRASFSETKFMDQTLNAITFTYDPIKLLPDSFSLRHWDVYVDPNTNFVRSIYLVKNLPGKKTEQLTWTSGKSCIMVTIQTKENGSFVIEKEVTLKWSF